MWRYQNSYNGSNGDKVFEELFDQDVSKELYKKDDQGFLCTGLCNHLNRKKWKIDVVLVYH